MPSPQASANLQDSLKLGWLPSTLPAWSEGVGPLYLASALCCRAGTCSPGGRHDFSQGVWPFTELWAGRLSPPSQHFCSRKDPGEDIPHTGAYQAPVCTEGILILLSKTNMGENCTRAWIVGGMIHWGLFLKICHCLVLSNYSYPLQMQNVLTPPETLIVSSRHNMRPRGHPLHQVCIEMGASEAQVLLIQRSGGKNMSSLTIHLMSCGKIRIG